MLIYFRFKNYKCFKDEATLFMEATRLKNLKESNTFEIDKISLLKSAVIYGPNASGKSSVIDALKKMKDIVLHSLDFGISKNYNAEPFLLNIKTQSEVSLFEVAIIVDNVKYRYGFEINIDSTIKKEWLYQKKLQYKSREINLFKREDSNIILGASFKEGKALIEKTRDNALFLTVVAQFNGEISNKILEWFKELNILSNLKSDDFEHFSFEMLKNDTLKEKIVTIIKEADVGIYDIINKKITYEELKKDNKNIDKLPDFIIDEIKEKGIDTIETKHIVYDEEGNFFGLKNFDLSMESDGTKKLLALVGPLLYTLFNGKVLVIDELDNSLHTSLVRAIVKLFNSNKFNKLGAQIIFTTHDTNLLDQELFRRDQIYFTQKDIYGASELYSLVEYGKGKARDDLALEKNYLKGKFGATPHINFSLLDE